MNQSINKSLNQFQEQSKQIDSDSEEDKYNKLTHKTKNSNTKLKLNRTPSL